MIENSCEICADEFLQEQAEVCENQHKYHKNCLEKIKDFPLYCPSQICCLIGPLNSLKNISNCLCCTLPLPQNRCFLYGNICKFCIEIRNSKRYLSKCYDCQEIHLKREMPCTICKNPIHHQQSFKNHSCEFQYCKACTKSLNINQLSCNICFYEVKKFLSEIGKFCWICSDENPSFRCEKNHAYCKNCMKDPENFTPEGCKSCENIFEVELEKTKCWKCGNRKIGENLENCGNGHLYCRNCLSSIPNEEIGKLPECCLGMFKRVLPKSFCKACGELLFDPVWRCDSGHGLCQNCVTELNLGSQAVQDCEHCKAIIEIYEFNKNTLRPVKSCNICKEAKESMYAQCEFQNFYCNECLNYIKNPDDIFAFCKCPACKNLIESIKAFRISCIVVPQILTCWFCKKEFKENYKCENGLYYCENCLNSIKTQEISILCQCNYCSQLVTMIEEQIYIEMEEKRTKEEIMRRAKLEVDFTVTCQSCKEFSDFALPCNHNVCNNCVFHSNFKIFSDFLECFYSKTPEKIPEKSFSICPVKNCSVKVRVSTSFFFKFCESYFSPENLAIFSLFLPYFDGIKSKFLMCRCGNLIGLIGKLKLNCACIG